MKISMVYFFCLLALYSKIYPINFSEDISRVIYENCTECHRQGEIGGPLLTLTTFQEVYESRNWISYAITTSQDFRHGDPIMPPWPPDDEYSSLVGERTLSESDVQLFLDWIDQGAPQGDPSLEYPLPSFPEGSSIGQPDLVLSMEQSVQIEGNYQDYYRCFIFDLNSIDDIYFSAMEVRPGNNEALHHTIVVAIPPGSADDLDAQDPGYGYECFGGFGVENATDLLGGYAPGTKPIKWGNGLAQKIPGGWDLVVQMHYAPVWEDMSDSSSINLFLVDELDVEREIESFTMIDTEFLLPPNVVTEVYNTLYVPDDVSVVSFFPHSHLLGDSWEVYATTSLNDTIPFIRINNWNFDWQNFYYPEYMLHVPSGSTIHARATYDNTQSNPDNPNNPPDWVWWGDGTGDEMFFLPMYYVEYQEGDEYIPLQEIENQMGDVNSDSTINILDVVLVVSYILGEQEFTVDQYLSSDLNQDAEVDVLDIILIISYILTLI